MSNVGYDKVMNDDDAFDLLVQTSLRHLLSSRLLSVQMAPLSSLVQQVDVELMVGRVGVCVDQPNATFRQQPNPFVRLKAVDAVASGTYRVLVVRQALTWNAVGPPAAVERMPDDVDGYHAAAGESDDDESENGANGEAGSYVDANVSAGELCRSDAAETLAGRRQRRLTDKLAQARDQHHRALHHS